MNYIESGIRTRLNEEYRELQKRADDLVASEDDLQRDLRAAHWRHQEGLVEGLELALSIMRERA
tara:strand:- start:251 stop:442 length:192 start_codon:yes stop_codon:yes gene_type:complete